MARFLGLAVQTDIMVNVPVGSAPTRVAFFRPHELAACAAVLSPTEPESLTVSVDRDDPRTVEFVMGRTVRAVTEGATEDREWDILAVDDTSRETMLIVTCAPVAMRLARVVYMGSVNGTGAADPAWTGVELTATEWLNALVIPTLAAAGLPFELGTVDNTTSRFTMDGEWSTVLEIIRAVCEPGRANAEFRLSPGGDYGYVIDLLDVIGGSAATVRVRTAVNLIETKRQRSLVEVAGRLFPRGSSESVATATMSEHLVRISDVVSGTVLEIQPVGGGPDLIGYDDQLNDLYFAPIILGEIAFASSQISDSVAATQRITIPDTTGMTAGDWGRLFVGSGANGARLTSLTAPTIVAHPTDGGYGDRGMILDRPGIVADCNLVPNAMLRDTDTDWEQEQADATDGVFSYEVDGGPFPGLDAIAYVLGAGVGVVAIQGAFTGGSDPDAVQGPAVVIRAPAAQPWNTAGRMHTASIWVRVDVAPAGSVIRLYLHDIDRPNAPKQRATNDAAVIGTWTKGTDDEDVWIRFESDAFDLSALSPLGTDDAIAGAVRVTAELSRATDTPDTTQGAGTFEGLWDIATTYNQDEYVSHNGAIYQCTAVTSLGDEPAGSDWQPISTANRAADPGWQLRVSAVTLAEAPTCIADREGSGGTQLWQEANAALPTTINPIKGYDVTLADLEADDPATYASLALTSGGTVEVADTDLGVVTSLRLVEYTRDYLAPIASRIRVGKPADTFTRLVEAGLVTSAARV